MNELLKIKFEALAVHRGKVSINGVDITRYVRGLAFSAGVGLPPTVTLNLINVEIDADTIVMLENLKIVGPQ